MNPTGRVENPADPGSQLPALGTFVWAGIGPEIPSQMLQGAGEVVTKAGEASLQIRAQHSRDLIAVSGDANGHGFSLAEQPASCVSRLSHAPQSGHCPRNLPSRASRSAHQRVAQALACRKVAV
jgi:hypothetical protein